MVQALLRGGQTRSAGHWLVAAANVAAAGTLVATIVLHVRAAPPAPAAVVRSVAAPPATPGAPGVDAATIAAWRLFGGVEAEAADAGAGSGAALPATIDVEALPPTTLALSLKGVATASSETAGYAIIGSAQGSDRRYRVGDTLPGETGLVAVLANAVVIDNGGRRELLALPAATAVPPGSRVPPSRTPGLRAPLAAEPPAP